MPPVPRRVFVSDHGNVYMREIAEHLVEALTIGGAETVLVTEELPAELPVGGDPLDQLVVAPHEFFPLFQCADADRDRAAKHSVCINTEQAGTPFFDLAMQYVVMGPVAFDINAFSLDAVRRTGLPAVHLPLGHVPSMDHWHGEARARSIDIGFMAGRTPRRELFIAGAAGQLWEWRTDLRFFSWHRPVGAHQPSFTSGSAKYQALADTRILLNVHRGDDPYFEWARMVEAVANGCVVASETSAGIAPFVAGEHMLMAPLDDLAEQAVAFAFDEPRRARMAQCAHELLVREMDQSVLVQRALAEARRVMAAGDTSVGARLARRLPRRLPARRASPATAQPAMTADRQMLVRTAKDLKAAYLAQVAAVQSIERSLAIARFGDANHTESFTSPAHAQTQPDVSVVVPLHNQGAFVGEAIDSVVACSGVDHPSVELIIVDDHSTDDSLARARQFLDEREWLPWMLVGRAANGGPAVARNTGFARARAPYVFALDADNVLYPNGLRVLAERLDASPDTTIAAYGLLERFDETGALGLTSHLPWDTELLVTDGYIDTMALFRRQAWSDLGGFSEPIGVGGWEGYDLWLSAAERGWQADLVTQVVGRYREHPGAMSAISDIDLATNFVALRERHPRLAWPS